VLRRATPPRRRRQRLRPRHRLRSRPPLPARQLPRL